jgi:hypothetical protein
MSGKDDDPNQSSPSDDKGLTAKADQSQKSSKTNRPPRKFNCSEHPSANSHVSKDCHVLKKKAREKKGEKEGKSEESDGAFDRAAVATWDMGEESDEDILGMVAVDTCLVAKTPDTVYIVDSGANKHMVTTSQNMIDLVPLHNRQITVGGLGKVDATHQACCVRRGMGVLFPAAHAPSCDIN